MKYSIIIPTLNEEKLLPGLLGEIHSPELRKKYEYEIILSDGGSTDRTIELALDKADIIKVHRDMEKQNIAMGRNVGAYLADGDVLIFLNGDVLTMNAENFFRYLDDKFYKSDFVAMTCKVKVFPSEEIISDKLFHSIYNLYFYLLNVFGVGMGRGECQVIRKEIFYQVNGNNESLAAGEDFDLFKRIRKHGKIFFSNELCIYESPRRYRKFGYSGVSFSWIKNSLSIIFKNRSISKEWEQVR
ncbi:MAG: glycosyltransferase [Ignavibacteriales bacterium]|nr:MAG: glycosyltransferase [Ignavibacteriales bacterium]